MATARTPADLHHSHVVRVPVTPAQLARMRAESRETGVPMAEIMRRRTFGSPVADDAAGITYEATAYR